MTANRKTKTENPYLVEDALYEANKAGYLDLLKCYTKERQLFRTGPFQNRHFDYIFLCFFFKKAELIMAKFPYTHVCGSTEPRRSLNSEKFQQILEMGLLVIK